MSRITDIKPQARREDRVSIYVDNKYSFSLAKDQIVQLGLKKGQELSAGEVQKLKHDSAYGKLRDNTYRWLSIRLRSKHEIEQYLARKTKDQDLIKQLISQLTDQGYVDDAKFTASWVRNRTLLKPISERRLKAELLQKRVPLEIITQTLDESELDDLTAAKQLVAKRGHRYPDKQKLMAYLARQGFSYDIIKQAVYESQDQ